MALNDSMSHSGLHLQVDAAGDGFQIPVSPLDSPVPGCSNGGSLLLTPEFGTPRMSPHRSSLVKDGTRRCVEKKSVSFGSMPKDRKISNVGDCIRVMQNGSEMVKIRSSTRRYRRVFSLDTDCSHLRWSPSNKKPHKAKIPVEMVREIRNGRPADNSARGTGNEIVVSDFPEECIFSVVWGDQYETLDLLANSADEANIWVTGLTALLSGNALAGADNKFYQLRDIWLTEQFSETANEHTLNAEGEELSLPWLSECQTIKLARVLNPNIFPSRLRQKIKELDCSKLEHAKGRITCNDFLDLYKDVSTRPEIYFLMVRLANKDYLTEADFQAFLENEQGICGVDSNYVSQLFNQYETSPQHTKAGIMGIDGFTAYLLSSNCTIFDPQHSEVCQDMTEPITHYFISASHNTYLIQDQLKGPSSIEGYIKALRDGCRFIEMDLWEIENNVSDIFVYHGHTLTSRLEVSKAFKAIKEYAFDKSSFPLILQLEIHLSIDLQFVLVDLLKSIFDDHLYLPPPSILVPGSFDLPSPDELRHKILIKGKKLDAGFVDDSGEVTEDDESAEAHFRTGSKGFRQAHGKKYMLLCRELSDLMCPFLKSTHYSDFQSAFEQQQFHEVCSMNEAVASRLANACPEEFVTYTRRFLTRIYPSGVRVDSSNFNPQEFWNCGCQIACMNFQTPGLMIDLNLGKFSANGGCGYVLKPSGMRDEFSAFSLRRDSVHGGPTSAPGAIPNILHLKIISAQHLPRPRGSTAKGDSCDPYVVIEIFGIPGDCAEERTKTVRNDSFNPFFDESFEFHIQVPDLALIRLLVLDDEAIGDDFIGQFTIPFDCLQTGYRHITLMSANSEPLVGTTLFVHLAITNKRGGGKAHKRGRSVMKKRQKIQTGIKQLGIKKFDESFKNGQNCLVESIQLRTALENHLSEFQSACGATGASGTIKQGMKILTSRIQNGSVSDNSAAISNGPQFKIVMHNQTLRPEMDDVTIPDVAKKCLSTFERLLHSCVNVRSKSDPLLNKLSELHKRILELYEDMGQLCLEAGLKEQKAIRASENFAWNVRIVKAQIETLSRVQKEAIEILNQMEETSAAAGQLQVCTEDPCTHI